jgi:hypothetical protein
MQKHSKSFGEKKMTQVSEFRNKEIAFLHYGRSQLPKRGYQIINSENLQTLKELLKIQDLEYNSYVTIATYSSIPRFPLAPKEHWVEFKQWVKERDETIKSIDFMLDFDAEPTIKGLNAAWEDVKLAKTMLVELIGEQSKYLQVYFSGNKGFHILGKCDITTTAEDLIQKQLDVAMQIAPLCPTLDTTIYDTARLRKLLGSVVYTKQYGKTRVIPVVDDADFKGLIKALNDKDQTYFNNKQLTRLSKIKLTKEMV